jgi:hypothetical protein
MSEIQTIQSKIYEIRGQRVMLDRDLAAMYGVALESSASKGLLEDSTSSWSQIVTMNKGRGSNIKYLPYAFTERVADIEDILHDQNEINESTRMQLDNITLALAELQVGKHEQKPRRRIGFIQDDDKK